jgi:Fic family protein
MAELVTWLHDQIQAPTMGLIAFLARLHQRFTLVHPFDDGNGRVVRLMINYVLLKAGLMPLVIMSKQRRRYLETIAMADAGDFEPFQDLLTEGLAWSLDLGIKAAGTLIDLAGEKG